MKIMSLNVKGMTNPSKVNKIRSWRKQQVFLDVLVLTEVKVSGLELEERFKKIDDNLIWITSFHAQGAGGIAMGIHPKWGMSVKDIGLHESNMWAAFELLDMILVGVYASSPQAQKHKIWESIQKEYEVPSS